MREFGRTDVDAETRREDPELAADDLDRWAFRKRFAAAHESSQLVWIFLAIVGAFVVVLLVRVPSLGLAGSASSSQSTFVPETPRRAQASTSSSPFPGHEPASSAIGTSSDVPMVYRCVGKGGAISLQSQPCSAGQRTSRAVYAPPEVVERPRRPVVAPSVKDQAISYGNGPSVEDSERERRRTACTNAKSYREETLARVGLSRTYDLLQRLDAMVYEACKGL